MPMPIPGPGMTPRYKTKEELQGIIEKYFESCWEEDWKPIYDKGSITHWEQQFDKDGEPMMKLKERPTITGLALALGFTTRHSLISYQQKDEFADTINAAKLLVEHYYESGGADGKINPATAIFALKNFGWTDILQINNNDTGTKLTSEEIRVAIEAAKNKRKG